MAYADFTLEAIISRFNIDLATRPLFPDVQPLPVPTWLADTLARGLALPLVSEKARSEFIVAPLLLTVREISGNRIAIYSGQRFDFDPASGLIGECDFILSATDPFPIVRAPIMSILEAKKGDIELGLGQCTAQMIAALRFNEREGIDRHVVYGCVTTGREWQFLRLENSTLTFDTDRPTLEHVGHLLAIFLTVLDEVAPAV